MRGTATPGEYGTVCGASTTGDGGATSGVIASGLLVRNDTSESVNTMATPPTAQEVVLCMSTVSHGLPRAAMYRVRPGVSRSGHGAHQTRPVARSHFTATVRGGRVRS